MVKLNRFFKRHFEDKMRVKSKDVAKIKLPKSKNLSKSAVVIFLAIIFSQNFSLPCFAMFSVFSNILGTQKTGGSKEKENAKVRSVMRELLGRLRAVDHDAGATDADEEGILLRLFLSGVKSSLSGLKLKPFANAGEFIGNLCEATGTDFRKIEQEIEKTPNDIQLLKTAKSGLNTDLNDLILSREKESVILALDYYLPCICKELFDRNEPQRALVLTLYKWFEVDWGGRDDRFRKMMDGVFKDIMLERGQKLDFAAVFKHHMHLLLQPFCDKQEVFRWFGYTNRGESLQYAVLEMSAVNTAYVKSRLSWSDIQKNVLKGFDLGKNFSLTAADAAAVLERLKIEKKTAGYISKVAERMSFDLGSELQSGLLADASMVLFGHITGKIEVCSKLSDVCDFMTGDSGSKVFKNSVPVCKGGVQILCDLYDSTIFLYLCDISRRSDSESGDEILSQRGRALLALTKQYQEFERKITEPEKTVGPEDFKKHFCALLQILAQSSDDFKFFIR